MRRLIIAILVMIGSPVLANNESGDTATEAVHNLREIFSKGHWHGHFRNYFMATTNYGELEDYWTNATGGALLYETAPWHGFNAGVRGIFTYRTFSADIHDGDAAHGGGIWEKELYDITRPDEKHDLDRLDELYIRYRNSHFNIAYGKQDINQGPLLLNRDGRMKPFVYRGFWGQYFDSKNHIWLGWIDGVSPRGMTEWYNLNEAIGIIGQGYASDGLEAEYHEKSHTRGLAVLGYQRQLNNELEATEWVYLMDKMFAIYWTQLDWKKDQLFAGVQYVHQHALPHQEELSYHERYIQPDEQANVVAAQFGWNTGKLKLSAAYLHAFGTGRFLYPREMGRENFYVSQPRSWMDGFGNSDVYQVGAEYFIKRDKQDLLDLSLYLNHVNGPGYGNLEFNKYNLPVYNQLTACVKHHFHHIMEGMEVGFLYVARNSSEVGEMSESDIYYRTNLHNFNLVLNIKF